MRLLVSFVFSIFIFGVTQVHNSYAAITVPATKTLGNMEKCSIKSVNKTFNRTIGNINRFAGNLDKKTTEVVNGTAVLDSFEDLQESVTEIQEDYDDLVIDVVEPVAKAYDSVNLAMIENMTAYRELTDAMATSESAKVYFMDGSNKIYVETKAGKIADNALDALDTIPTYDEMSLVISEINKGNTLGQTSAGKTRTQAGKNLKKIKEAEKAISFLSGEDFSFNDAINDIEALQEAAKIFNLESADLPAPLSFAANIAKLKPVFDAFMLLNTTERMKQISEFIETLEAFKDLQALQDGVYESMTLATEFSENLQNLQKVMTAFSAEPTSIRSIAKAVEAADETYNDAKEKVGDMKKMAADMKKMAADVKNIQDTFKGDIADVTKAFQKSADLGDLLKSLKTFPSLVSTAEQVEGYLAIGDIAKEYYDGLLGFGKSANDTQMVLTTAKPHVNDAKNKLQEWGNNLEDFFFKQDAKQEEMAKTNKNLEEKERTAQKLKRNYKKYREEKKKVEHNIAYLKDVYKTNKKAYDKLVAIEKRISRLADSDQIEDFALETLGVTDSVKDVYSAYKAVRKVSKENFLEPVENFQDTLEDVKEMEGLIDDVQDVADQLASAKQLANGLAGNLENLGGLIKCFDVDVDALIEDTLLRVQDTLVEDLRQEVWESYSEAIVDMPYLLLPEEEENKFDSPFKKSKEVGAPLGFNLKKEFYKNDLLKLANVDIEEKVHPEAGLQYAGIRTVKDLENPVKVTPNTQDFSSKAKYSSTMSAWNISYIPKPKLDGLGVKWRFGDWSTTALAPLLAADRCDFNIKRDFCWYWRWHSCGFISKCYKAPYLLPTCNTEFNYKEPTVQVEVAPRAGTSQLLNLKLFKDIPSSIDNWAYGGKSAVPSVHVMAISPMARYRSEVNVDGANLTMVCDLSKKMEKYEHVQYYGIPTSPAKMGMMIGTSLVTLKDWKDEWFTDEAAELGTWKSSSLQALYLSELNKNEWNPRTFPNGETPSGETKPDYEDDREKSYRWALPYLKEDDASGTTVVENIMQNKCDAGLPSDGTNVCVGKWGALFPRNGQVITEDPKYPLKHLALLAYRAYDRVLEEGLIGNLRKQPNTQHYGVGYENTEFSLDWPYQTERMPIGEDPKNWANRGYMGDSLNTGGLIMTLWKDTSCCVKVCCKYPGSGYYPGESYYFSLPYWEDEEWAITEVTKHK